MRALSWLVCAALLTATAPASAEWRPLDVPNDKGWQHARTGVILMAKIGDFQRTKLTDNSKSELDVAATYYTPDKSSTADIYIYRPGIVDLPMWFDRSQYVMTLNDRIPVGAPLGPITRFALPGSTVESGLRIVYSVKKYPNGATGLAMAPIGDWLVAIRLTSVVMDSAKLDATLAALIANIRWPANRPTPMIATPVAACTSAIKYKHAKVIKPDLTQALLGAALSSTKGDLAKGEKPPKAPIYCRDSAPSPQYTTYRPDESRNAYVVAIGDAGVAAEVSPAISLTDDVAFSVVLKTLSSSDSYPNFNALPEPKQVFAMLNSMSPMSSSSRGGKDITLAAPSK